MSGGVTSLSNHLLIAMPQLADPNFSQTVSLICEHGEKGALGIVLNRPLTMTLSEVFEQMKIEPTDKRAADLPVLRGGPVHQDRGFVLHRPGGEWDSTHKISDSDPGHHLARRARRHGHAAPAPRRPSSRWDTRAGKPASSKRKCSTTPGCRCPPMKA